VDRLSFTRHTGLCVRKKVPGMHLLGAVCAGLFTNVYREYEVERDDQGAGKGRFGRLPETCITGKVTLLSLFFPLTKLKKNPPFFVDTDYAGHSLAIAVPLMTVAFVCIAKPSKVFQCMPFGFCQIGISVFVLAPKRSRIFYALVRKRKGSLSFRLSYVRS